MTLDHSEHKPSPNPYTASHKIVQQLVGQTQSRMWDAHRPPDYLLERAAGQATGGAAAHGTAARKTLRWLLSSQGSISQMLLRELGWIFWEFKLLRALLKSGRLCQDVSA